MDITKHEPDKQEKSEITHLAPYTHPSTSVWELLESKEVNLFKINEKKITEISEFPEKAHACVTFGKW